MSQEIEFKFEDHSVKVLAAMNRKVEAILEEAAGELEAQAIRNTKVGKGTNDHTKEKWRHKVMQTAEHETTAVIGNESQVAIWLEFGTGEHAIPNPDGKGARTGGWYVPIGEGKGMIPERVVKAYKFRIYEGKNGMRFIHTYGMKPQRPLWNAYNTKKASVIRYIQNQMRGL